MFEVTWWDCQKIMGFYIWGSYDIVCVCGHSGGDVSDLERTRQYLNEAFQSGAITCLICIASVKRTQAVRHAHAENTFGHRQKLIHFHFCPLSSQVWSCVGCYCIFHIPCIQKWAKDSIFLVSSITDEDFGKKDHPWPWWGTDQSKHSWVAPANQAILRIHLALTSQS